ncbi:hypothetical protein WK76_24950 [Burkholderia ubonensis]|uniref:ParB/RepB/Spo0J family partition protein n=1 Tax=Burkholderia ubonensis TaxID=101571 RepID=UPI000751AD0E|nr:ParB/RepB/Spo0J family partition protein [Burkholderia ubonensis]KVU84278.1 hypothetical protein WK76_24950 [Burkholderia ubonensis]
MALDLSVLDEMLNEPANHVGAVLDLPLEEIEEDPDQPRRTFSQALLEAMAKTIRQRGVGQPIIVRPKGGNGKYRIVSGARRFRASKLAGKATIPAVVRADAASTDKYAQVIENVQREELAPTDLAAFIDERRQAGDAMGKIAEELGLSAATVSQHLALLNAPESVRTSFDSGQIGSVRAAYDLSGLYSSHPQATDAFLAAHADGEITTAMVRKFAQSLRNDTRSNNDASPTSTDAQGVASIELGTDDRTETEHEHDAGAPDAIRASEPGQDDVHDVRTIEVGGDRAADAKESEEAGSATPSAGQAPGDGPPIVQIPFHNPGIEHDPKPVKLDDPTRIKKPLLLANYESDAVMVRLDKKPTSPGLAFVKYEDGRGEIEVVLDNLTNWTLMELKEQR